VIAKFRFVVLAALALVVGAATPANAQDYPNRNVRVIVPYPAGGTTDVLARLIAEHLTNSLKQTFVIDNRPGAGTNIGTGEVLNAPADGYTLLVASPANAINATLFKKMPFNFQEQATGVAGFARVPNVMVVHPDVPAKTVPEFIAWAKKNQGKVNFASSGNGSSIHLSGELFKSMTGVQMTHVPYKGSAPAMVDMLSGQVHVMFDNLPSAISHVRAGKLRALAVTSEQPAKALPGVPTVAETVKGFEASSWFGIAVRKGTPQEVIDKLNKAVNAALKDPKIRARIEDLGGIPFEVTPAQFTKFMADETAKWAPVVKASGATVD
jgi:tripartite-type tricarboxylate transporter receptor subunit TctC